MGAEPPEPLTWPGSLTTCLWPQFCKYQELETLKDLYNQDDNHQELGSFHIRASYAAEEV